MSVVGNYIHYNYANYGKYGTSFKAEGKSGEDGLKVLETAHDEIVQKVRTKSAHKSNAQLEAVLNGIVYGRGDDAALHQRFIEVITSNFYEQFLKWAVDLENGIEATGTARDKNSFKYGEATGFHTNRLKELKSMCEMALAQLAKYPTNEGFLKIKQLAKTVNQALTASQTGLSGKYGDWFSYSKHDPETTEYYRNIIKNLNEQLAGISASSKNQTTGELFEAAILVADDMVRTGVGRVADNVIDEKLTGTKTENVTYKFDRKNKGILGVIEKSVNKGDTQASITLDNTPVAKATQGTVFKADAHITFNDEDYRISAKNYQMKDYSNIHVVSGTPFLTALMRNLNGDALNHAFNLLFSLGDEGARSAQKAATANMLKRILAVEGLTGINRTEGYADTLAINNRSKQEVKVLSMADLIPNASLSGWSFSGMPDLEKGASQYNIFYKGKEKQSKNPRILAKHRVDNLLVKLHSFKVSISINGKQFFANPAK